MDKYKRMEAKGRAIGRFHLTRPRDCDPHIEADTLFVAPVTTDPLTEILIERFAQERGKRRYLEQTLQGKLRHFFEDCVASRTESPFHVQYRQIHLNEGVECIQGFALIRKDHAWIARACARKEWTEWYYFLHWNGPEEYSEELVQAILDTFVPLDP